MSKEQRKAKRTEKVMKEVALLEIKISFFKNRNKISDPGENGGDVPCNVVLLYY